MATPGFVSYNLEMDEAFRQGLERASSQLEDLRPALRLIAADFYRSQKAIFQLKGPGGYPPFKGVKIAGQTPYQKYKIKKYGFDYPLLKATGSLEYATTNPSARGAIYRLGMQELVIGTNLTHAIYHQSDAPRKKIPLRKFLFIGPEASTAGIEMGRLPRWLKILNNYVLRSMGATGAEAIAATRGVGGEG